MLLPVLLCVFIDNRNENLPVISDRTSQGLQIAIHKLAKLIYPIIQRSEVSQNGVAKRVFELLHFG